MKVAPKPPIITQYAERAGRKFFAVPDGINRSVEIAFDDSHIEAFVFENESLVSAKGYGARDKDVHAADVAKIFSYLNRMGVDISKVADAFSDMAHKFGK